MSPENHQEDQQTTKPRERVIIGTAYGEDPDGVMRSHPVRLVLTGPDLEEFEKREREAQEQAIEILVRYFDCTLEELGNRFPGLPITE